MKAWTLADLGISAPQNRVNLEALYVPDTSVETEVIEGETATVYPVEVSGAFGAATLEFSLVKVAGKGLVNGMER